MAKLVQISDDAEVSWDTLPGGTGSFNDEMGDLDDTIFGQTYQSSEKGLQGWTIEASALYKGFAGYLAKVLKQGTSTAMTAEAMTVESGQIFAIDDATKDLWDRAGTFVVFDVASDETANVEWFDYLFGRIKFLDSYTVIGAITIDGDFFPKVALGKANAFTLTQTAALIESSDFATVQANNGSRTFDPGLRTVGLDLSGFYDVASGFRAALKARNELVIEIDPVGNGLSICRGFFKGSTEGQSGDVGATEDESTTFALNVPQPTNVFRPFGWRHDPTSTLALAVQKILTAWLDETKLDAQYLYDGVNGVKGMVVVSEASLSGGLEAMNEFNVTLQGDGDNTDVGTG